MAGKSLKTTTATLIRKSHRRTAESITLVLIGLQAIVLGLFALDEPVPGSPDNPLSLFWAADRKSQITLLIALLVAGLPCTWFAWQAKGSHRRILLIGWALFIALCLGCYARRIHTMLVIAWRYG